MKSGLSEIDRQRIQDYSMPQVPVGTPVIWYRYGRARRQDAMIGYMIHCGARNATIFLANGRRMDAVRHVDDPKLDLNVDQREQGAWDFTQEYKDFKEFRNEVNKRLLEMENAIAGLQSPDKQKKASSSNNKGQGLSRYRELKAKCQELGIDTAKMSTTDMQKAINSATEAVASDK